MEQRVSPRFLGDGGRRVGRITPDRASTRGPFSTAKTTGTSFCRRVVKLSSRDAVDQNTSGANNAILRRRSSSVPDTV